MNREQLVLAMETNEPSQQAPVTAQALIKERYQGAGIPSTTVVEGYRNARSDCICDCDDNGECCGN